MGLPFDQLFQADIVVLEAARLPDKVAVALIDVDIAKPTEAALLKILPKMSAGGMILVDDCDQIPFKGARQATDKDSARSGIEIWDGRHFQSQLCGGLILNDACQFFRVSAGRKASTDTESSSTIQRHFLGSYEPHARVSTRELPTGRSGCCTHPLLIGSPVCTTEAPPSFARKPFSP